MSGYFKGNSFQSLEVMTENTLSTMWEENEDKTRWDKEEQRRRGWWVIVIEDEM